MKMSETKKYLKIKDLKEGLKSACIREKYEFTEAPTYEIEGTVLQSDYIPGRKNIFIQNFEPNNCDDYDESSQSIDAASSSTVLVKGAYSLSVEQVALTHFIKNLDFTHGKHAETSVITTLYGLLFWNIIFDDSIANVFVDKFQSSPLDMQTDYLYQNRKFLIDAKIDLIRSSPIDFICELYTESWNNYIGIECSLVSWSLFESLEEFLSLVRCFNGIQLANLCKYISENYRYCRSGGPDLIIWSTKTNKCRFVEVKGPGDRLSL
jgi:Fanconi-associated nuclease 1